MELSWSEYKKVIEGFFHRCFDNCRLIEDYEDKSKLNTIYDFINEDNFYVKYFCKSLEGEMLKFQKQYFGVRDHKKYNRCKICGKLIEKKGRNHKYCYDCKHKKQLEWQRNSMNKLRNQTV